MFFKGNIEIEARDNPPLSQFRVTSDSDFETFMIKLKPTEPYPHITCDHKGY